MQLLSRRWLNLYISISQYYQMRHVGWGYNVCRLGEDYSQDNIEFKIPKSYVEGYRGNDVFLGLNGKDIQYYQF